MRIRVAGALVAMLGGCFQNTMPVSGGDVDGSTGDGWSTADAIAYRDDLAAHPGCTTEGLSYPAAVIPGYACAAKQYAFPDGVSEDTSKPIVILVHGNSDSPAEWEAFPAGEGAPMISEQLVAEGFRVYAVDLRIDTCDDPQANNDTQNAARNVDHGWAVPIVEEIVRKVAAANPGRHISLVGFSLGSTVVRDALRRLHREGAALWPRIDDVVLLAGAHHGVSSFARLCGKNPTMRGRVACEMGARDGYSPTDFAKPLAGPDAAYETPCSDGEHAFGESGACGGHAVHYTTVVMRDIADGSYQDEFVSEASAALAGADNRQIELSDVDESGYFFNGLLKNHYGSARSAAAVAIVMEALR